MGYPRGIRVDKGASSQPCTAAAAAVRTADGDAALCWRQTAEKCVEREGEKQRERGRGESQFTLISQQHFTQAPPPP
ncbi:hypothetical protein JOB18_029079 [Solea senegalensis]|uniref:Uncharacterized protein n=1 Tax=Solea senegalensis TaxID=28829 RepID=A0AAV6RF81_SOLSE|nr:hypothetical protein JOB18_029079 [Solea senegalensis]